ncbi:MAG: nitrogenase iron-molybdenum cofactor biosynthesis protein NifE [Candidatus Aureabacteria bacterium]|nr:nitrogenase iron-molybdenum cofactor biosynthesis protein NifE [Candidatus Auribacterota bacterium]
MDEIKILKERKEQIYYGGKESMDSPFNMQCEKKTVAGSVSQRACVFCGSRVVLYPIVDALHLVHGPIGCAAYTWDIRGSLSSGRELHRLSFSTDLQEKNVIFGGEKKLYSALCELIDRYKPEAAFVYATCIIGIIGDDIDSVCRRVGVLKNIPVLPVHSEGFKGTKKDGYRAACEALAALVGSGSTENIGPFSINLLGDFNIAGETWLIKDYYSRMGVEVVSTVTGDGRVADIQKAHGAKLNVVQCSGSMMPLAKIMKERYGIPFTRVSYFGIEDTSNALYEVARFFKSEEMLRCTDELVNGEVQDIRLPLEQYKRKLKAKKAAIYVGGAFKAFSLIKALDYLGMKVVVVGSQTGNKDDYRRLKEMCGEGTIIVDDANPLELSRFILEKDVDIFIGGVKERYLAYKLGIGFCDHNHQRKIELAGFKGMLNFAREVYSSVTTPVWQFTPRGERKRGEQ